MERVMERVMGDRRHITSIGRNRLQHLVLSAYDSFVFRPAAFCRRNLYLPVLCFATLCAPVRADSAQLHNTAGLAFFYQGKDKEAYSEFVKAVQRDPGYSDPRYNLGRLFERQNRLEEALEQYRAALQLDPSRTIVRDKVEQLQKILATRQPTPAAPVPGASGSGLGQKTREEELEAIRKLLERSELSEARARLDQLKLAVPQDGETALLDATIAEKSGNVAGTLTSLQTALTFKPSDPEILYRLADSQYRLRQFDDARTHVDEAIRLKPNDARAFTLLGLIDEQQERPADAFNAFQEASRLDPSQEVAVQEQEKLSRKLGLFYYNAGLLFFQQKNWMKAQEALHQALDQGNLSPEQMAIAQQYLIVAEFSMAKVAEQIQAIQDERDFVYRGQVSRRVTVNQAENQPVSFGEDTFTQFTGNIVWLKNTSKKGTIIVTRNSRELFAREGLQRSGIANEGGYRHNTIMEGWFTVETPQPLPKDPRVREGSQITIEGRLIDHKLIRNPWNFTFSRRKLPVIQAARLSFLRERRDTFRPRDQREELNDEETDFDRDGTRNIGGRRPRPQVNTNPGLSGPLRIDYLKFNEEQKANLPGVELNKF